MNNDVYATTNFLVPAAGQTHCVSAKGTPFTATPYAVDWRAFKINEFPFQPQGVIIDNTQATSPVTVTILPIGFPITCPAGAQLQVPFPAPNGQTAQITGGGGLDVTAVYFVDYPVLPFYFSAAQAGAAQNVIISDVTSVDPLPVVLGALAQGSVPYRMIESPALATAIHALINLSTVSVAAPANSNLRRVLINITGSAAMAAAGDNILSIQLNGATIFTSYIGLPAAGTAGSAGQRFTIEFENLGISSGAAGNFVMSLGTALTAGVVEANAYFTPQ